MLPLEAATAIPVREVGYLLGVVIAAALGGGATHAWKRRASNGHAGGTVTAQNEVLRQKLYDQRHDETMRALEGIGRTSAEAANAAARAAESAREASDAIREVAGSTERTAEALARHLDRGCG